MTRLSARIGIYAGIGLAAFVAGTVFGQSGGNAPGFELADVHPSAHMALASPGRTFMRTGFYGGGRYEIHNATMVDLVRTAYGLDPDKVLGGPAWVEIDRFDVIAKAPPKSTPDDLKLMLKTLLAERFKLVVHDDKKELPTHALRVGKKSLLKPSDGTGDSGCKPQAQAGAPQGGMIMTSVNGVTTSFSLGPNGTLAFTCHNMTMAAFVEALHGFIANGLGNNPILDETELKGSWDFDLKYSLGIGPPGVQTDRVSLPDAVDKQLGLKLEAVKAPLPVIVIDSVNEKPTDNAPGVTKSLPATPVEFEAADVKPSDPNPQAGMGRGGRGVQPGGRVEYRGMTLKMMISMAWGTTVDKVVDGPKFVDTDRFDIVAKAPVAALATTGAQIDDESLQMMMRAMLKDRFKLAVHSEDRPADTYILVAAKPKLKKADPANRTSCPEGPGPDGKDPRIANPSLNRLTTCLNMTMAQFADLLPSFAPGYFQTIRTVVDATGLEGAFDFTLSYSANGFQNGGGRGGRGGDAGPAGAGAPEAADPGQGITVLDALEKQLGLKLETQKRPSQFLVVDHVEQKPTDDN